MERSQSNEGMRETRASKRMKNLKVSVNDTVEVYLYPKFFDSEDEENDV